MKQMLFVAALFSLSVRCVSQRTPSELLIHEAFFQAIQSEVLINEFTICALEDNRIDIFDFNNQIPDIPVSLKICSKQIAVYNTICTDHPSPNSIVVYNLESDMSQVKIYFWRPFSGAVVILSYKKAGDIVKLVDFRIGSF
jgi:hypothetical protein